MICPAVRNMARYVAFAAVLASTHCCSALAEEQLLLDVQINRHAIGRIGEFVRRDNHLYARSAELRELGLREPQGADVADRLIDLSTMACLRWRIDPSTQTVFITARDQCRVPSVLHLEHSAEEDVLVRSGLGTTVNYNLVNTFVAHQTTTHGVLDLREFSPWGIVSSTFLAYAGKVTTPEQHHVVRLDSAYSFADPSSLRRYVAGDFISAGLSWSRPVHMEGVQLRSDFSLRPDLITFPLPSISGSAAVPSTVSILTNDASPVTRSIEPGPFEVPQLPVATGAGTISMTVANALGEQEVVNKPFYASASLLTPGLQDYSLQLGRLREDWGTASNSYGPFAMNAAYRRGLTSKLTAEGTAEITPTLAAAGGGLVVNAINRAVVNADLMMSEGTEGPGMLVSVGLQRVGTRLSFGWLATFASSNFRDTAALDQGSLPRQQLSANFGFSLRRFGSLAAAFLENSCACLREPLQTSLEPVQAAQILSINYSAQVGKFALIASAFQDLLHPSGGGVTVGFTAPLGRKSSLSVSEQTGTGWGQVQVQRSVANVGDWGYQAYAAGGDEDHAFVEAQYKSGQGLFSAGIDHSNNQNTATIKSQGAISLFDGGLFPSNTIYDSFAVADTGMLTNIPIYQEHREIGRTNSKGKFLIADLRSFDTNLIAISATDVPLAFSLETTDRKVRPQDRTGIVVRFPVHIIRSALFNLLQQDGQAVPVGSHARLLPGGEPLPVGYDGEVYVEGLTPHNTLLVDEPDGGSCKIVFDYNPGLESTTKLGPFTCMREP